MVWLKIKQRPMRTGRVNIFSGMLRSIERPDSKVSERKELDKLRGRELELKAIIKELFEQNALGGIADQMFAEMLGEYQNECSASAQRIAALETELSASKKRDEEAKRFVELVSKYTEPLTELTRETLFDLIEKIVVYDADGKKWAKHRRQRVDIHYRFVGMLSETNTADQAEHISL